jgi:hypothetical protein
MVKLDELIGGNAVNRNFKTPGDISGINSMIKKRSYMTYFAWFFRLPPIVSILILLAFLAGITSLGFLISSSGYGLQAAVVFAFLVISGVLFGLRRIYLLENCLEIAAGYVNGYGRKIRTKRFLKADGWERAAHPIDRAKWFEENLEVRKWKGILFVSSAPKWNDIVHPHTRLQVIGVPYIWHAQWFDVTSTCVQRPNHNIFHRNFSMFGAQFLMDEPPEVNFMGFYRQGEYSRLHSQPTKESVSMFKPEGLSYVELHDLVFHEEEAELFSPDFANIPGSYVKSMYNIPLAFYVDVDEENKVV